MRKLEDSPNKLLLSSTGQMWDTKPFKKPSFPAQTQRFWEMYDKFLSDFNHKLFFSFKKLIKNTRWNKYFRRPAAKWENTMCLEF